VEGANNGCKPSAAHPHPVVLVHATFADEGSNWVTLAPLLANNGYCVYAFNYGETWASAPLIPFITEGRIDGLNHIEHSAEELRSFVNNVLSKTGASKVDLVGHSQGGMMPNYYIKFLGGAAKVNELIGLAPSNHGTTLGGIIRSRTSAPAIPSRTSACSTTRPRCRTCSTSSARVRTARSKRVARITARASSKPASAPRMLRRSWPGAFGSGPAAPAGGIAFRPG
jgi:pimeloyl-ACP methyl ester carboxylesterase